MRCLDTKRPIFGRFWYISSFVDPTEICCEISFFGNFSKVCLFQRVCLFPTEISDLKNILKMSSEWLGPLYTFSRPIWTSRTDFKSKRIFFKNVNILRFQKKTGASFKVYLHWWKSERWSVILGTFCRPDTPPAHRSTFEPRGRSAVGSMGTQPFRGVRHVSIDSFEKKIFFYHHLGELQRLL